MTPRAAVCRWLASAGLAGCVRVTDAGWAARLDGDGDGALSSALGAPGWAATFADLDGDGAPELLAGLPGLAGGAGGVAVVHGPLGPGAWSADAILVGGPGDAAGRGVAAPAGRPVIAGADLVWLTATLGR